MPSGARSEVPGAGVEPARCCSHPRGLSPLRLPVPPPGRVALAGTLPGVGHHGGVIETVAALEEVVAGTNLVGREVAVVPAVGGGVVLAVRIGPEEVLTTWRTARALVDVTGRWPVAMCGWMPEHTADTPPGWVADDLPLRVAYDEEDVGAATDPASIIERAAATSAADVWARLEAEAVAEEDDEPIEDEGDDDPSHLDWYVPSAQPVALVLLPDPVSEHALAHVHWFAAHSGLPTHEVIALLRDWRERHDAELVAHWGTMLQLVVGRPPATLDESRPLARAQELIARDTTFLAGVSSEHHARALVGRDRWFLHSRP